MAFASLAALAERQPLSRYQSIIDRHMFGLPPPGFDPDKNPNEVKGGKNAEKQLTAEQEKIQSAIRFSMINITPSGETAVGFTDKSDPKGEVHYYLKVGETRNGWTVKEADPVRAWMRIAKGEIEVELELGGDSAKGGGTTKTETAAKSEAGDAAKPNASPTVSAGPGTPSTTLLNSGGIRGKRRSREQREAEREAKMEEMRRRYEEDRAAMREELAMTREAVELQLEEREREGEEEIKKREAELERREAALKADEERRERERQEESERQKDSKEEGPQE